MNPDELRDALDKANIVFFNPDGEIPETEAEKGEKVAFVPEAARCKDELRIQEFYTLEKLRDCCDRRVDWLDVCCGKMALLNHIDKHLKTKCRNVAYTGFDININYLRDCAILIHKKKLKDRLASIDAEMGDVKSLRKILHDKQYNFISLSNALHEIRPFDIASLLVDCLHLCADDGIFVIVDMQNLIKHEKWSVTWTDGEMERILKPLFPSWKEDLLVSSDPIPTKKGDEVQLFLTKVEKCKTLFCKKFSAEQKDAITNKIDLKVRCILREKRSCLDEEIWKHYLESNRGKNYERKLDSYHTIDIYLKGYKKKKNVKL